MAQHRSQGRFRSNIWGAMKLPAVAVVAFVLFILVIAVSPSTVVAEPVNQTSPAPSCPYFELPNNAAADWSTCVECHLAETERYSNSTHGRPPSTDLPFDVEGSPLTQTCADCHLPERADPEQGSAFAFKLTACETCHMSENEGLEADVHTEKAGLVCTDCHDSHSIARGKQEAVVVTNRCTQCHLGAAQGVSSSPHSNVQEDGYAAALCSDCHNPHEVRLDEDPRVRATFAVETCTTCHDGEVARSYDFSFHGTALELGENRVATCVDCHSHHAVETFDPSAPAAVPVSVKLAQTCGQAGCHMGSGIQALPADYKEHVIPKESAVIPVRFTWKFFIILILFDTLKDGPIVIAELIRTLVNDARARLARRRGGEAA